MTVSVDSVKVARNSGATGIFTDYEISKPLMFTSAGFWIFLLALLCIYSLIFNKPVLRNTYLFLFSLFFYYKSGGIFFLLLLISTLTDYAAGWMIYISERRYKKTIWLIISLSVNLGMLAYFKYTAFFTDAVNNLFGTDIPQQDWLAVLSNNYFETGFNINSIILPVGISFFTFQTISYTIDIYRNKTRPVKNILDFGFYVSFFPQLVAGPIVRASEFIPQLYQKFSLSRREWSHALLLIVAGLIKKIAVSDYIAVNFVDSIFDAPGSFSGLENLLAVYGYGLQIYCDFSGYTDIAIGVALMLGFRLPVNFNSPYKAANITDFWRRWHISLSRWLKDYLYISLGGNRRGRLRTNINLLITMLIGGLWHGAALRFILWGGIHGIALIIHKSWMRITGTVKKDNRVTRLISIIITFNFVSFCWILFRAEDMESARIMLERIISGFNPGNLLLLVVSYAKVLTVMLAAYIIHFLPVRVKESYRGLFIKMPLVIQLLLVYIIAIALFNIQLSDIQPFIYFRF
jgi:D-alanyl-lipoteichoic acid acyltransferase DltB (MBOAT superfamily)